MADIRINALANTATTPASDDYLALDGAAQGTRKILATNIANNVTDVILGSSGPSVKSTLSARAPRQGLVFDGTAGATVSVPAFGTADFTVSLCLKPTTLANSQRFLGGTANGFEMATDASGGIFIIKNGVATTGSWASVLTAGKWQTVTYKRTGGVGTLYINGVANGSTISDSVDYSGGIGFIGAAAASGATVSISSLVPLIYNRALSASEVVELYEAGAPAGADYNNASNTSLITGDNSTFASDTGYWTKSIATISGGNLNLSSDASYIFRANLLVIGKKYRYVTSISANTTSVLIGSGSGAGYGTVTTTGTITGEFTATSTTFVIYQSGAGAATVGDITLFSLGLLLAPDAAQAGGGLVWYDTSGNAANISWTSGVSWNVPTSGTTGGNRLFTGLVDINNDLYIGSGNIIALARNNPTYNTIKRDTTNGGILLTANSNTLFFKDNGRLIIGSPSVDGGQTLQVSGTANITGEVAIGTLSPGNNTAAHFLTGYAANQSWPARISAIYDANFVDTYVTLNGTLTGTRATPTFTGATTGGAYLRFNGGTSEFVLGTYVGGAGAAAVPALTLKTGDATFAGTIAIGQYTTAGAPAYAKGKLYFDVTLNKLRVGGATGWETVTSV